MSCKLYLSLTASDFPDNQVGIHWALSFFKSRCIATFAKCIIRQEIKSGQMTFIDWNTFMLEFVLMFCPENEVTTALMQLESKRYFQGRHNIEAYIDEFKDLIDMSMYTDLITIILKFCRGLNVTTQDRIAESGTV
jgi:hypothetical protein